jgi:hypothetical protein
MEKSVVVLCGVPLIVSRRLGGRIVRIVRIGIVKSGGRKRARLNSSAKGGLTHIAARRWLLGNKAVLVVFGAHLRIAVTVRVALRAESETVGGGTGRSVGDGHEGDDGTDDDGGFPSAACANERVALVVVRLHAHGGESQVGAVNGHDS